MTASLATPAAEIQPRVPRWLSSSVWAVADQGFFSLANLIPNVLLIRWLSESAYGGFTVAFQCFLILGAVHSAFLIEPMLVFGNSRFRSQLPAYLAVLVTGTALLGGAGTIALTIGAVGTRLAHQPDLAIALAGFAGAGPFILFAWLARRFSYVRLNPMTAALAGAACLTITVGGLLALYRLNGLNVLTACAVMALANFASGLWMAWREGAARLGMRGELARQVVLEHWRYGRWACAAALVGYVTMQIYSLILPAFAGLAAGGALRAMINLVMPVVQANAALGTLLVPRLAGSWGTPAYRKSVRTALILLGGAPILYWLGIGLFHEPVVRMLYKGKFLEYSSVLWVLALQPIFTGVGGVFQAVLGSRRRPDLAFYASGTGAIVGTVSALLTAGRFGVAGMAWSGLAALITFAALACFFALRLRDDGPPAVSRETALTGNAAGLDGPSVRPASNTLLGVDEV